jgi:hypothetical protein
MIGVVSHRNFHRALIARFYVRAHNQTSAINRWSHFMLNLESSSEGSLSLADAAVWIARATGSPKPHVSTVNRWARYGVKGVRLQGTRVGAKFWTTADSIAAFLDALNMNPVERQFVVGGDSADTFRQRVRRKQVDDACAQLDSLCKGWDGIQSTEKDTMDPMHVEDQSRDDPTAEHQRGGRGSN